MLTVTEKRKHITAVVDRIEGNKAVLKLDDGQSLLWSMDNWPSEAGEGTAVKLVLMTNKDEEAEREKIAKAVLNEILKVE